MDLEEFVDKLPEYTQNCLNWFEENEQPVEDDRAVQRLAALTPLDDYSDETIDGMIEGFLESIHENDGAGE